MCITLSRLILLALVLCAVAEASAQDDARIEGLKIKADVFIQQLVSHEFETATAPFDSTMLSVMPTAKLKEVWASLLSQVGMYQNSLGVRVEPTGGYQVVIVTAQFEQAALDCKVVYDAQDRISGLYFAPASNPEGWQPPEYANPEAIEQIEMTFGDPEWLLPGTLYLPKSTSPAAALILVHGSGPNDRDETIGPNKPFRDLALGLASKGVAVFAYEKRTRVHGQKMVNQGELTIDDEVTDDALAAVEMVAGHQHINPDKVYLLGHSLGGMMAPQIAERSGKLAGIVILAGTPRPLEDLLLEQMKYIDSIQDAYGVGGQMDIPDLEKKVQLVKSAQLDKNTRKEDLPLSVPPEWWLSIRGYEPDRVASNLTIPILILHGMRDYQVTKHDLRMWQFTLGQSPHVTIKTYDELNHLFMAGEGPSTPAEYSAESHVDPRVINDIAEWIAAN